MATWKQLKAAILARRAAKGPRKKRTRPKPRQYTIADLERARDRVAAAERRIDNDRTNNPNRGPAIILAGPTVLSAVGACPPHDGVRRRWWINVASVVSLIESSQKLGRSHHRHRPGRDVISRRVAGTCDLLMCLRGCLLLRPVELGSVDPHAVQNDRELARDGDCGLSEPICLASLMPQAFSADHFGTRVSSTPAASKR